ncbi:MAG: DNA repair protein RecN [Chitinophagaceae bacterium]|nr:DNA repair protein RecN [Chitinophagaceae bacterium]MBK8607914.1 DNA repair protein RecN [Chitinophagaceae bacterium]MBP6477640.1 DNA repair protein RecN [Chitinophagaceae bacterium]MBP7107612.1 DNA repair protein RecN [Chitinophagaceae bacterium]MBP7314573.1 DNA repair protein RecN [Chitinophagaceae bacterium]
MLARLSIQNYAIIDELEIEFSNKLNIITGETGAGKSIIVGALGLILGTRADSAALVNKAKKCVIEGVFNTGNKKAVTSFLKENELDADDEIVVRREIATNGKSRAFINDTPVNLSQLQQLSFMLVDLHLQFDTLEVGESDFQREVVDALAGNADLLEEYQLVFRKWQFVTKECDELKNQKQQFDKEADYNRFQFIELDEAAFKENELEEIDAELKLLSNSEGIKEALGKVYFELSESESPVPQQLKVLVNQLAAYSTYHPQLPELLQRLTSVQLELQDIAGDVDRISSTINFDLEKIEQLNERLSLGYKLQKKHGVNSSADLLALHKELEEKLQAVLNIDNAIQQKEKEANSLFTKATEIAKKLSAKRTKQVNPLEENVNELLSQVGMPNAKLKVEIKVATLNIAGTDTIEFLFDANRSGQFQPVRKVASGGELSRLMLSIKSLVAASIDLPSLIFDEIDTGISGEAAKQVGIIMKDLAANRQVICITHQPQIAGKADAHFFVYKEIVNDAVKTNIRKLSTDERITTIAKMLSGEKPTAAAMENAREMLMN